MLTPRRAPIIVVGMHRSGTSLFARCLHALGVFVGRADDKHEEDVWFRELNTWVTAQCHAGWEQPRPVRALLEHPATRAAAVDYLELSLTSPRSIGYLGPARYLRARSPLGLSEPWGWKDPVNTVTLPLWLDVFPDAKVIHIRRHGVDVAQSLHVRHAVMLRRGLAVYQQRRALYRVRPKGQGFGSVRTAFFEECFAMWEEYLDAAVTNTSDMSAPLLELTYEGLLDNPGDVLQRVAEFAELQSSAPEVSAAAEIVRGSGFGFRTDPALVGFAEAHADRLARFGY